MTPATRIGAVSYLNTKPLLYGIERSNLLLPDQLKLDYPANLASMLRGNLIDAALLPVAAIPSIANARIISNYGIASDGDVVSVAIFSQVPIEEVTSVYLDYQSRTSVRLAQLLLQRYWKRSVTFKQANEHYIDYINGTTAGVIIGDRALKQLSNFEYVYDLSAAWKAHTGLDFVFAAWVANKELPAAFIEQFDAANAEGLKHIDEVIQENPFPWYDLDTYYRKNIRYELDSSKREGLRTFLEMIQE
jgi:chorismate dehydratase